LGTIALVSKELELHATKTVPDAAVADDSRLIRREVERCRAILQRMSTEGAEPAGEALETIPVEELLTAMRVQFSGVPAVDFDLSLSPLVPALRIPRHAVEQALFALVKNAVEASSTTSPVRVRVTASAASVLFAVADQGQGMSPETLKHVGEPFFTTKDPGQGMGLGTFLVRTLAERLGGTLRYESIPGRGTTALFELPIRMNVTQRVTEDVR
jgi:two-component system sensor histidine kinase RegB